MERTGCNAITIKVYSGSTDVSVPDLTLAEGISFSTLYPGGLFGVCQFFVPRNVTTPWALREGQRLVVRNGLKTVWEGRITSIEIDIRERSQGNAVTALGYWGDVVMARSWRKWWADTRLQDQTWRHPATAYSANDLSLSDVMSVDLYNRLRFTPKAIAFTANQYQQRSYTMPTGQTAKRITFNYDMQEAGQAWQLQLFDLINAASLWDVTSSGTGSVDLTLATPSGAMAFLFRSMANQTAPEDGTVYGQVTSVVVYSETGAINLTEVTKDVRAKLTELSANENLIASNTFSLVPFISEVDTYADILMRAAGFGDASFNAWAVGVRESDLASDGKPVLFAEAYPALTDYDYAVRLDEPNVVSSFSAAQDISEVRNWIAVKYTDDVGNTVIITPDDDANLKDTTSIADYGERHEWIDIDTTSATTATNYGRRYLAARKDPQWRVTSDIQVRGFVRSKQGETPASEIRAGKRVKVENFLGDLNGSGLTLLITGTDYDDERETCRISVGRPDSLDVWLAQSGR